MAGELTPIPAAGESMVSSTLFGTDNPAQVMARASKVAKALADVVEKCKMFTQIGSNKHLRIEAWQTLGSLVGVFGVVVWTRKIENGWEARVEARTKDGFLVGAAESECLNTERNWSEASKKEDHHLRSMAQTRATSKALAQPLRFIVSLAGYAGTPAEEMPLTPTDRVFERREVRAPAEKKAPAPEAPAPAQSESMLSWRGQISKVTVAEYAKKVNGQPTGEKGKRYTIYGKLDETNKAGFPEGSQEVLFTTFSETHANDAKDASQIPGCIMVVNYSVGEFKGAKQYKAEEVYPASTGESQDE